MKKFLTGLAVLMLASMAVAYVPNYSMCGIQGAPQCSNLGPYDVCTDPCGQIYYKWHIGGQCQEGTCFEYQWVYDSNGNGPFQVIVPLPSCPYATCNNEGGELSPKPDVTTQSAWGNVKKLYR